MNKARKEAAEAAKAAAKEARAAKKAGGAAQAGSGKGGGSAAPSVDEGTAGGAFLAGSGKGGSCRDALNPDSTALLNLGSHYDDTAPSSLSASPAHPVCVLSCHVLSAALHTCLSP